MMFNLGDKVTIVGGVLREYSIRLDGLTGLVVSSRHDAPPGTIAVYVEWKDTIYADWEHKPTWVNVPPDKLQKESDAPIEYRPAQGLRLV